MPGLAVAMPAAISLSTAGGAVIGRVVLAGLKVLATEPVDVIARVRAEAPASAVGGHAFAGWAGFDEFPVVDAAYLELHVDADRLKFSGNDLVNVRISTRVVTQHVAVTPCG